MTSKTISAAIVGMIVLGFATWQFSVASDLRKENAALTRKLSDTVAAKLNASKLACADRAQRRFTSLGYNEAEAKDKSDTTFQNHFSTRLGRCLMTLETGSFTGGHQVNVTSLIDVDEQKDFGRYGWVSSDTKKYYDQKPGLCIMSPPDKDETYCHSTDEWDAYVKEMLSS